MIKSENWLIRNEGLSDYEYKLLLQDFVVDNSNGTENLGAYILKRRLSQQEDRPYRKKSTGIKENLFKNKTLDQQSKL